jgi:hypothetical protein
VHAHRWAEIIVERTERGEYAARWIGRSTVPGEHDRERTFSARDGSGIYEAFFHERGYLTVLAGDALREAAAADDRFAATVGDRPTVEDLAGGLEHGERIFVLTRDRGRALRFRGRELAHETSRRGGSRAWQEFTIYAVGDGRRYVVAATAWREGELRPHRAALSVVESGDDAAAALRRASRGWLPLTALAALTSAAAADPRFADGLEATLDARRRRNPPPAVKATGRDARRKALEILASGRTLLATRARNPAVSWATDGGRAALKAPHARVFLALSRERLIQRSAYYAGDGVDAWEISAAGRAALERARAAQHDPRKTRKQEGSATV